MNEGNDLATSTPLASTEAVESRQPSVTADVLRGSDTIVAPSLSPSAEKENSPHDNMENDALNPQPIADVSLTGVPIKPSTDGVQPGIVSSTTQTKESALSEQPATEEEKTKHENESGDLAGSKKEKCIDDKKIYGTPTTLSSFESHVHEKYGDGVADNRGQQDDKMVYGTPRTLASFESEVQQKHDDGGIPRPRLQVSSSMGTPEQNSTVSTENVPRSTSLPVPAPTGLYRLRSSDEKKSPVAVSPESSEDVPSVRLLAPGAYSVVGRAIGGAPAWAIGRLRRNSSTPRRRSRQSLTPGSGSRRFSFQTLLSFRSSEATDQSHIPPELRVRNNSTQSHTSSAFRASGGTTNSNVPPELRVPSSTTSKPGRKSDIEAICEPMGDDFNKGKDGDDEEARVDAKTRRSVLILVTVLVAIVAVVVVVVVATTRNTKVDESPANPTQEADPSITALQTRLEHLTSDSSVFGDSSSPQRLALKWLAEQDDFGEGDSNQVRLETRYSLAVLYYATNGDAWVDGNEFLSSMHECNWTSSSGLIAGGLKCDSSLQITGLDIGHNGLNGFLPEEISALSYLTTVNLRNNSLTGELPPTLTTLAKLTQLDLSENKFSSTLPFNIGRLEKLSVLILGRNDFVGSIPQTISLLHQLKELDLSRTSLSGPILGASPGPGSQFQNQGAPWINLKYLEHLDLSRCQFTGTIPTHIVSLSSLIDFRAEENLLTGSIPLEQILSSQINLTSLTLFSNTLSGTIPSNITHPLSLRVLDLSFNNMESSLPESIGTFLPSLEVLNLARNSISGTLPPSLGMMSDLIQLNLQINYLQGEIPSELSNCTSLTLIDLGQNHLVGQIPSSIGKLTGLEQLHLGFNQLGGSLPSELGNLQKLSSLRLPNNDFTGSIPLSFLNMSSLEFAAFAANDLEGDVGFLCAVVGDRNNGEIVAQFAQHMKLVCTESCCRNA